MASSQKEYPQLNAKKNSIAARADPMGPRRLCCATFAGKRNDQPTSARGKTALARARANAGKIRRLRGSWRWFRSLGFLSPFPQRSARFVFATAMQPFAFGRFSPVRVAPKIDDARMQRYASTSVGLLGSKTKLTSTAQVR
jgi:hypothetical protein